MSFLAKVLDLKDFFKNKSAPSLDAKRPKRKIKKRDWLNNKEIENMLKKD